MRFNNREELYRHRESAAGGADKKFLCPNCGRVEACFVEKDYRVIPDQFRCTFCGEYVGIWSEGGEFAWKIIHCGFKHLLENGEKFYCACGSNLYGVANINGAISHYYCEKCNKTFKDPIRYCKCQK